MAESVSDIIAEVRRENAALRLRNGLLEQQVTDAAQAMAALASGEVDAVALSTSASPILLRAAQEKLRDSQQLLRAIVDSSLEAIMLADDDGKYIDANPAAYRLFGVSREELIGHRVAEFASENSAAAEAGFHDFRQRGQMVGLFTISRPDGSRRTLDYSAVANVAPGMHLSVLRDITEKLAAEEALRRNEALFRAVIEKSAEIISLTSADGKTRYLTPSAWSFLGWTPEEMGAQTFRDQVIPEDRARVAVELERLVRTNARDMSMEIRVRHRDGSIRWVESTGTNLLDDPDVRAIVGNYRDITARKHAEGGASQEPRSARGSAGDRPRRELYVGARSR